jgi:hypothetical protein
MISLQEINDRVERLIDRRPLSRQPLDSFLATFNGTTKGATVTFKLVNNAGIGTLVLRRNFSMDFGSSAVVNTWDAQALTNGQTVTFDDSDSDIKNNTDVFYWVDCQPTIKDFSSITVGPQQLTLTLDQLAPNPIVAFDASHEAASGGTVSIGIVFKVATGDSRFGSCRIYISGYNGVAATVEIAQNATSPFRFNLLQTGETVTLTAVAVSLNGIESTGTPPTKVITLGTGATTPAKIIGASAVEIATGVQISFPAGPESNITLYQIFRGPRGQGFAASSSIGTVTPTGSSAYTFLDSSGLGGVYEWFVFSVNPIGSGTASDRILPASVSLTSADQPPNAPSNSTNNASVTSSDAGTDVTIDVSGFAGIGTSWTRPTGYGTQTLPHFTIQHKAYSTKYWVVWDTVALIGQAFTSAPSALADNFAFAGVVTTVGSGGSGGVTGGGGSTGGGGGGNKLPGT